TARWGGWLGEGVVDAVGLPAAALGAGVGDGAGADRVDRFGVGVGVVDAHVDPFRDDVGRIGERVGIPPTGGGVGGAAAGDQRGGSGALVGVGVGEDLLAVGLGLGAGAVVGGRVGEVGVDRGDLGRGFVLDQD